MAFERLILAVFAFSMTLTACGLHPNSKREEESDLPQKVMSAEVEPACNQLYKKNLRGKRLSWKGATPISFSFDTAFPPDFVTAVESAMNTWNLAAGYNLFRTVGFRKTSSLPSLDGQNTIYFFNKESSAGFRNAVKPLFQEDGTLAVTRIHYRRNQILETDIVFDGVTNSFSSSRIHVNSFDVEGTALHELGHALGLGHNDQNPFSIMFFGASPLSFSLRTIDATSKQMLDCEYEKRK